MKTTIVFLAAMFLCVTCFAQKPAKEKENKEKKENREEKEEKEQKGLKDSEIPAAVKTAFAKTFPNAKGVKWSKESVTEFEAEFKAGGKEMSSNFDQAGKWVATETEIQSSELPPAVTATLAKDFAGYKIEEAEKVETPDKGTYYELAVKNGKKMEVEINRDGKVMKK